MNHLFNKSDGRYIGTSINNVDNSTVGHTELAPDPALVHPTWNGEAWVEGEPEVPLQVSRRQGKQQLVISGLDEMVDGAIDAIEDPVERKLTRIWYNDADYWELDNPQLLGLASVLGLTHEDVIELLKSASQL